MLIRNRVGMFTTPKSLPSDSTELRIAAEGLDELAKTQALQIEKLKHQLAGHQRYRFRSKVDSADQLNLQLLVGRGRNRRRVKCTAGRGS